MSFLVSYTPLARAALTFLRSTANTLSCAASDGAHTSFCYSFHASVARAFVRTPAQLCKGSSSHARPHHSHPRRQRIRQSLDHARRGPHRCFIYRGCGLRRTRLRPQRHLRGTRADTRVLAAADLRQTDQHSVPPRRTGPGHRLDETRCRREMAGRIRQLPGEARRQGGEARALLPGRAARVQGRADLLPRRIRSVGLGTRSALATFRCLGGRARCAHPQALQGVSRRGDVRQVPDPLRLALEALRAPARDAVRRGPVRESNFTAPSC